MIMHEKNTFWFNWIKFWLKYWSGPVMIGASAATNNDLWISHKIIDWDNSNYFLDPGASSVLNELKLNPGSPVDVSLYWRASNTGFYAPEKSFESVAIFLLGNSTTPS